VESSKIAISGGKKDEIVECMWNWKDQNKDKSYCDTNELARQANIPFEEIKSCRGVENARNYYDDLIYFFD
jgi:hypothetical protein